MVDMEVCLCVCISISVSLSLVSVQKVQILPLSPILNKPPAPLESDYPVILWGKHWLTGKLSVKKVQTRNKKHLHSKRTPSPPPPTIILDTPVFSSEKEFKDCARSASLEKRSQKEPFFLTWQFTTGRDTPLAFPSIQCPNNAKVFYDDHSFWFAQLSGRVWSCNWPWNRAST